MPNSFKVRIKGAFYGETLYDQDGKEIIVLEDAVSEATRQFGENWTEVYNGKTGAENGTNLNAH